MNKGQPIDKQNNQMVQIPSTWKLEARKTNNTKECNDWRHGYDSRKIGCNGKGRGILREDVFKSVHVEVRLVVN